VTEIHLCDVCSCQEILSGWGRTQLQGVAEGPGLLSAAQLELLGMVSAGLPTTPPASPDHQSTPWLPKEAELEDDAEPKLFQLGGGRLNVVSEAASLSEPEAAALASTHRRVTESFAQTRVSLKRLLDESPCLQFASERQRF
jgi:hypothetical protein